MYYKEEIVNGIICYKLTTDGEWMEKSKVELTLKITRLEIEIERLQYKLDLASRKVHEPI